MEYEYRELSTEKSEQLNAKKYKNMYRRPVGFDGGRRCVTTADEEIVFRQIGHSHEDYIPDQFFLNYNGWYFYIYMFEEFKGSNKSETGKDYYTFNKIERITNATLDRSKEEAPAEEDVLQILKGVIPVWNRYNGGRLNPGDQIITIGIEYKGAML